MLLISFVFLLVLLFGHLFSNASKGCTHGNCSDLTKTEIKFNSSSANSSDGGKRSANLLSDNVHIDEKTKLEQNSLLIDQVIRAAIDDKLTQLDEKMWTNKIGTSNPPGIRWRDGQDILQYTMQVETLTLYGKFSFETPVQTNKVKYIIHFLNLMFKAANQLHLHFSIYFTFIFPDACTKLPFHWQNTSNIKLESKLNRHTISQFNSDKSKQSLSTWKQLVQMFFHHLYQDCLALNQTSQTGGLFDWVPTIWS